MVEAESGQQPINPFDPFIDRALSFYREKESTLEPHSLYFFEEAIEEVLDEYLTLGGDIRNTLDKLVKQRQKDYHRTPFRIYPSDLTQAKDLNEVFFKFTRDLIFDEAIERYPGIQDEDDKRYYLWDPQADPANWEDS